MVFVFTEGLTMYTTQKQVRAAFWAAHPHLAEQAREAGILSKPQNFHCATVRCTFVDFVDHLLASRQISYALADRVTL
jgi:hypothetical protein